MERRPTIITVICVLGFIGAAFTLPAVFMSTRLGLPGWYPPYLLVSALIGVGCMVGLWQMRKWAAFTYTGFTALNQVVLLVAGLWSVMALIIPGIVVGVCLANVKNMR